MTASAGHRAVLATLYAVCLGTAAYFAVSGRSYYLTPVAERARHEDYWERKPAGTLGLRFGIAGAGMMVVMLGYSLRKRSRLLRRAGPVGVWLDYHILLGICGPVFVLLHSSFKVGGLVALSFWSMVSVAVSGVVGRFLYRQIPRTREGDELSLAEAERLDGELADRLVERFRLSPEALAGLDAAAGAGARSDGALPLLLLRFPLDLLRLRLRLRRFRAAHPQVGRLLDRELRALSTRKAQLRLRIAAWQRVHRLFHYWHVFHRPFALIMYLFMAVHVAVAWMTGYGWRWH